MSQEEQIRIHQEEAQGKDAPIITPIPTSPKKPKPSHWKFFTELELLVVKTLKRETLTSQGLANRLGTENSSTFRTQLANLVERMIIIRTRNGYRINK